MSTPALKQIIEAALMAAEGPMTVNQLVALFDEEERPEGKLVRDAIKALQDDCETRAVELKEVASGFRFQAKQDYAPWLKKMWEERPPRYSRAFLETLVLIAYRQPITRAEIEEIRGVAVNSHIVKTLAEREWIKVVGHRDVPGKPALLGTTKEFLDYFNLKSLSELPTLEELKDLDAKGNELEKQLELSQQHDAANEPNDELSAEDIGETVESAEEIAAETNDAELLAEQAEVISAEAMANAEALAADVDSDTAEMSIEEDVFAENNNVVTSDDDNAEDEDAETKHD